MLKWLHENPNAQLDKLILVAPWIDPAKEDGEFLQFDFNKDGLKNVKETHLLISDNDGEEMQISTSRIMGEYPNIKLHRFHGKGHFTERRIGKTFPELWDIIKG